MIIRNLMLNEIEECKKILKEEGIDNQEDYMNSNNTFVLVDNGIMGFFYFILEHGIPSLRHFIVKKERRSPKIARLLIKAYLRIIKDMGFTRTILSSDKEYLSKFIEYFFKVKPYSKIGDLCFYIKEV